MPSRAPLTVHQVRAHGSQFVTTAATSSSGYAWHCRDKEVPAPAPAVPARRAATLPGRACIRRRFPVAATRPRYIPVAGVEVGSEQHPVPILFDEFRSRARLAADFVIPAGDIEVQIGETVHGLAQRGEIIALVGKVAGDKNRLWVARQQAVSPGQQLLVRRHVRRRTG